mmetsp:Transcript_16553/g.28154  ORF Transcript_16553/g.28154 Transcript_16553/m.28154 type:complete len:239 (+) Transcript_16553:1819-2535(+)
MQQKRKMQMLQQEEDQNMDSEEGEMDHEGFLSAGEEGEEEYDEEMEDEEGELESNGDDFVSDEEAGKMAEEGEGADDEKMPKLVKIDDPNLVQVNNQRREESSPEISDVDPDDFSSSSEDYDSDELNRDTTANPHGFVFANMLNTFQKSRKDRIDEMREQIDKTSFRDKFKKKKNSKQIGKSERVHQKNKPFMMVKKKKIDELRQSMRPLNKKKTRQKQFLGHFKRATAQRIESKKKK